MLSTGYLNKNDNKKTFFKFKNKIWYRTGDIPIIYKNTYLIKGRRDRIVKIKGYRVDLTEIEKHLRDLKLIKNAICIVNNRSEKFITALIESTNKIPKEKIINYLRLNLPIYMIPKNLYFIKKFPLNKNGKVDRSKLLKLYQ